VIALLACAFAAEPVQIRVDRSARTISVVEGGEVIASEPVGIGRGGLGEKTSMSDFVTPTGTFTVDLVLHASGDKNAVAPGVVERFAAEPEYARLLSGEPGLSGLFENMNGLDFDGNGQPDGAYGVAYVGLSSETAITGPKMRRHSKSKTPYWYGIALHGTPDPDNLGAANSGGCVHLSATLLEQLIEDEVLAVGATVTID